jgi:hypothetical protein
LHRALRCRRVEDRLGTIAPEPVERLEGVVADLVVPVGERDREHGERQRSRHAGEDAGGLDA